MIHCHLHDYIEIACLYKLEVVLLLKDNTKVDGTAFDTWTMDKKEYFRLQQAGDYQDVLLNDLKIMTAKNKNPYFDVINFVDIK